MKNYLIFTDLDGTLLNHANYSIGKNKQLLRKIKNKSNQIIFNSSKTYLEVNKLLDDLGLTEMPFSTENGAMVFFPKKVFKKPPKSINHGNFWKIKIAKKTSNFWYQYLHSQKKNYHFEIVLDISKKELKYLTNLDQIKAMLNREASQLIIWKDSILKYKKFKKYTNINKKGKLTQGGRFIQLSSSCNKGMSSKLISHTYFEQFGDKFYRKIIALGDNENDIEMLNYATYPCLINSQNSLFKLNKMKKNLFRSKSNAPRGWIEAMMHLNKKLSGKIF
tara:strand:- start:2577 stop:3407 length:831 start_codon:yes stop_codon:yes gene_type:complete